MQSDRREFLLGMRSFLSPAVSPETVFVPVAFVALCCVLSTALKFVSRSGGSSP